MLALVRDKLGTVWSGFTRCYGDIICGWSLWGFFLNNFETLIKILLCHFPLSFSSHQSFAGSSTYFLFSLNFMAAFPLILILTLTHTCTRTQTQVCVHVCLSVNEYTNSTFRLVLLVCTWFQGWALGTLHQLWQGGLHPGERLFLFLTVVSCLQLFVYHRGLWISSAFIITCLSINVVIIQVQFRQAAILLWYHG